MKAARGLRVDVVVSMVQPGCSRISDSALREEKCADTHYRALMCCMIPDVVIPDEQVGIRLDVVPETESELVAHCQKTSVNAHIEKMLKPFDLQATTLAMNPYLKAFGQLNPAEVYADFECALKLQEQPDTSRDCGWPHQIFRDMVSRCTPRYIKGLVFLSIV